MNPVFFAILALVAGPVGSGSTIKKPEKPDQKTTELTIHLHNPLNRTITWINLPDEPEKLSPKKKTLLVFYALPNGNSIEWTMGKRMQEADDWHYDIQQIAAQTRYLRTIMRDYNVVVVYMANELKSWPAWKRERKNGPEEIKRIVDSISGMFSKLHPEIMLNSHSGGGSFIFGYIDAVKKIPDNISRIGFIDSEYGYEDSMHTNKLVQWLRSAKKHCLTALAYNDSVVIYNGKPLVSPTGGTWYRTRLMQKMLSGAFRFKSSADTSLIHYTELSGKINIILKTNSEGKIYHTEQVARNGFIFTVLAGSSYQKKARYRYWGDRAYEDFILP